MSLLSPVGWAERSEAHRVDGLRSSTHPRHLPLALVFWLPLTYLNKLADDMQLTLHKFENAEDDKAVVLDSDARLMACAYRVVTPVLAVGVAAVLILFAGVSLAHYLPIWIEWALDAFGIALAVSAV